MPIFNDDDATNFKASGSGYQFSGTKLSQLQALGASKYTLVAIGCDRSTSVESFGGDIEKCLKTTLEGCQKSPQVDNLLVRLLAFNHSLEEVHGYRPLADCHLAAYDGFLQPGGQTALYDATVNLADSLATYGQQLVDQDYEVNGLLVVITDGVNVGGKNAVRQSREAIERAKKQEALESLVSILIGINVTDPTVSQYLASFKDEAGFREYVEAKDATAKTFAKIANFISRSVSSQSQSVGSKQASQPVTF